MKPAGPVWTPHEDERLRALAYNCRQDRRTAEPQRGSGSKARDSTKYRAFIARESAKDRKRNKPLGAAAVGSTCALSARWLDHEEPCPIRA